MAEEDKKPKDKKPPKPKAKGRRPKTGQQGSPREAIGSGTASPELITASLSKINKSEIENPTSEIKIMDVQHHPDIEKKGLKEYILEGLMIFMAVTLGFFAEGLREHISDRAKETEYVVSLNQDLQHDTANLAQQIHFINLKIVRMDSLMLLLNKTSLSANEVNDAYFYARVATRKPTFKVTDRTVVQLKSAGTFRLIKNEDLISRILEYQQQDDSYTANSLNDVTERGFLYPFISKIFDANVFQTMVDSTNIIHRTTGIHYIKKADKEFINQFIYYIHQLKSSFIVEKEVFGRYEKEGR